MISLDEFELGIIEIIATPDGEFPEEVRREWIGVQIPCLFVDYHNKTSRGLVSKKLLPEHVAYDVLQEHAIAALGQKSPWAASHFNEMGYPAHALAIFSFNEECVKVIKQPKNLEEILRQA